uniref:Large ribosomal subunit protein eL22 n=1 Tax=Lynx canadensis TaxID=61383 RepID=A0A667GYG3_LYNCA
VDAANFKEFLQERIKANGEAGNLSGGVVTTERSRSKITVTSDLTLSRWLKGVERCTLQLVTILLQKV